MPKGGQGRADLIYGLVAAVAALAMFAHTFSARYSNEFLFGDVSTVFFPRLLLGTIALLSLGLAFKGLRSTSTEGLPNIHFRRFALTFGATLVGIALVWYLGYLIGMPVGVFLVGLALGYPRKLILAATSVAAPLIVWLVLARFAQVSFPTGTLF